MIDDRNKKLRPGESLTWFRAKGAILEGFRKQTAYEHAFTSNLNSEIREKMAASLKAAKSALHFFRKCQIINSNHYMHWNHFLSSHQSIWTQRRNISVNLYYWILVDFEARVMNKQHASESKSIGFEGWRKLWTGLELLSPSLVTAIH